MNTTLIFILLYFLFVGLVIEISVIMFRLTGLEGDISRYQVISMLTGTGFTTDESQLIIDHPVRRRLSMFLILFGAFSLAVIISSITNMLADDLRLKELMITNVVLLAVVLIGRTPLTKRILGDKFHHEMEKKLEISELPIKDALYLENDDVVTDIAVEEESPLIGKTIGEFIKNEEDLNILFIQRGEVNIRRGLWQEKIQEGDRLYIYGNKKDLEKRFLQADEKVESTSEESSSE